MAELINLVTWTGINVTPMDDALIYESAVGGHGLFYGGTVSIKNDNTLHIAAGHGIICGRKFTIVDGDIQIELAPAGSLNGRVYIHLDLSNASEPIEILIQTASSLSPPIQDDDVNIVNGVFEFDLATFSVDTVTISNVVNVAPYVRISNKNDNIAIAELSPAVQGHAIGTHLFYNNTYYEVTQPISPGDTLVVDGNIRKRLVGDEITALQSTKQDTLTADSGIQIVNNVVRTKNPRLSQSADIFTNPAGTVDFADYPDSMTALGNWCNVMTMRSPDGNWATQVAYSYYPNYGVWYRTYMQGAWHGWIPIMNIYGVATQSANGLMSAGDKWKLDNLNTRVLVSSNVTSRNGVDVAGTGLTVPVSANWLVCLHVKANGGHTSGKVISGNVNVTNPNTGAYVYGFAPIAPNGYSAFSCAEVLNLQAGQVITPVARAYEDGKAFYIKLDIVKL